MHEVLDDSSVRSFSTLFPRVGGGFQVDVTDRAYGRSAIHDGLPWFICDMRVPLLRSRMSLTFMPTLLG